jgi:hypothetical protein
MPTEQEARVAFARHYLFSLGNKHPKATSIQEIVKCVNNPQNLDHLEPFKRQFQRWLEGVYATTCEGCNESKDCSLVRYGELEEDYEFLCVECRGGSE